MGIGLWYSLTFHAIEPISRPYIDSFMPKRKGEDFNEAAFRVVRGSTSEPMSTAKGRPVKNRKKESNRLKKAR